MELFLGVDIGTSASRGVIADINGKILADQSVPHDVSMPHPGWAEQDADKVWWKDFTDVTSALIKTPGIDPAGIKAVGVSAICPCVLPVDKNGKPLRAGILYGIDSRAGKEIRQLEDRIGRENIFNMSGQNLSSQSCSAKILWIKNNEPDVYKKTSCFLTAQGYLVYKLTGRFAVDIYDAPYYAPLYDIHSRCWEAKWEKEITEVSKLPDLLWTADIAGALSAQAAQMTGLKAGTPVTCGTADALSEAISVGLHNTGDMMMMYGSSNFYILRTEKLLPQEKFWAGNFITNREQYIIAGGMTSAGNLFKWLRQTFPGRGFSSWEALSENSKPGAGGLTLLPYFAGERAPINAPYAKGNLFGITLRTTAGDVYRAFQEAAGYGIRHNLQTLKENGIEAARILAIGSAAKSRQFLQIVSDICGCRQLVAKEKAGASYGNAFMAALGAGFFTDISDIDKWVSYENEIIPNEKHRGLYSEGFARYKAMYGALEPFMRERLIDGIE